MCAQKPLSCSFSCRNMRAYQRATANSLAKFGPGKHLARLPSTLASPCVGFLGFVHSNICKLVVNR